MNADDFVVYTGNTKYLRVTLSDPDGSPHNLTNEDIDFVVKATKTGNALITKHLTAGEIEVIDAVNGILKIILTPTNTNALLEQAYRYEIKVISAVGEIVTVLDGNIVVKKSLF